MSSILTYRDGFEADGSIVKMGTFVSKGGGLMLQVQLPLEGNLAAVVAMHLGNIAEIKVRFSSAKPQPTTGRVSGDGQQTFPFSGPTAEPAPDETHQAGVERIASTCPACGGVAYMGEDAEDACETCGGTGVVYSAPGQALAMIPCENCHGIGNTPDDDGVVGPCVVCHGTGKVEAEITDDPLGDAAAGFEEDEDFPEDEDDEAVEEAPQEQAEEATETVPEEEPVLV
jgi:hypothetical protein